LYPVLKKETKMEDETIYARWKEENMAERREFGLRQLSDAESRELFEEVDALKWYPRTKAEDQGKKDNH
jgi:hypothetical protein